MRPWYFIHAPSNPPDHACLDQTAQNHPDRTQVSDISEIRWSKCPTPPTLRHPDAPKDQIRGFSIGSISTHNVENMCLLFQHVKVLLIGNRFWPFGALARSLKLEALISMPGCCQMEL
jgi:hypothetical protein